MPRCGFCLGEILQFDPVYKAVPCNLVGDEIRFDSCADDFLFHRGCNPIKEKEGEKPTPVSLSKNDLISVLGI